MKINGKDNARENQEKEVNIDRRTYKNKRNHIRDHQKHGLKIWQERRITDGKQCGCQLDRKCEDQTREWKY